MKKTKVISVVITNQLGEFRGDYTLEFKKTKNGEAEGILTAPYIEWYSPESCELAFRVLPIKNRLLECIEKYYFDHDIFTMDIRDYPYSIEMCDLIYKVIPPEIYDQMISGTFTIKKDADPEIYEHYFQLEKENKAAIRNFINEQKKLRIEIKPKTIMYARKLDTPSSSDENISIILVNKLSKNDKYKVQIYFLPASEKKQILMESEFDDIYIAKKLFDLFEYKDKDVLFNKEHFELFIKDFTEKQFKNEAVYIDNAANTDNTKSINTEKPLQKINEILEQQPSSETKDIILDMFANIFKENKGE